MNVIVGCECSGIIRDAFIRHGHNAISCDLSPTESPGPHIKDDILNHLNDGWDLGIFHPPCTRLCNSGVCWLEKRNYWNDLDKACKFFINLMEADIEKIALENPIPHKYALKRIGKKYDQIIQPWMFGHMEQKATCLWLKNLPLLIETKNVYSEMMKLPKNKRQKMHYMPPSLQRGQLRSKSYTGIGEAMAKQWGNKEVLQIDLFY